MFLMSHHLFIAHKDFIKNLFVDFGNVVDKLEKSSFKKYSLLAI